MSKPTNTPTSTEINDPVINSPFEEPRRHFLIVEGEVTNEVVPARRKSIYFMAIPAPKKKAKVQKSLDGFETDQIQENEFINYLRDKVASWRTGGYQGLSRVSRKLLEHWSNRHRENKLFFCQIEALETAMYLAEAAKRFGDNYPENLLREISQDANPGLYRIAFKMATGSGKTVVMAMLIAWQTLN